MVSLNLRYLHFGPVIAGAVCDGKICSELLERGRKTTQSHVEHLAGHIKKENLFGLEDRQWFLDNFQDYFIPYFKRLQVQNDPSFF